jgi:pimeloyl-ACP methyl ester carboxylesterase
MFTVEHGSGAPLIFIPGLQGRWEYLRPAIDALSQSHRVITFPLCDEPSAGAPFQRERGFDAYVAQVESVLDEAKIARAAMCGISFGGLVALRAAATIPERVTALVLASTPGPGFHLKRRHRLYARVPWLFGPLFAAESPSRLRAEVKAALPDEAERRHFMRRQMLTFRQAPLSVARMAARALLIESYDRTADCSRIACPTLIVHGEPSLDFVVDAHETASYAQLVKGARVAQMERTGHLGSITHPRRFAEIVGDFLNEAQKDNHHSAA